MAMVRERSKGNLQVRVKGQDGDRERSRTEPGPGLTSADLSVADAALAGRPWAGGPRAAAGTQLLPSATGDAAVLPGAPGAPQPRPGAGGHLLALQDACHAGAGDKGRGVRRQGPACFPRGPPAQLSAHASLALLAHQLSQGPVTTSPGSRLSQELSPDPAEWLAFSGIPEGIGAGRHFRRLSHHQLLLRALPSCLHPRGQGSWCAEDTEAPTGTSPGTRELPIPVLQSQAGPRGQGGRRQAGGRCCAQGWVGGGTDPWLQAGTGSGTGRGAHKGRPGTAGLGGTHSWAAGSPSSLAGTRPRGKGPRRSGGRAAHRGEDPGHPHSLQQEGSREGGFGEGSILGRCPKSWVTSPPPMHTTC